VAGPAAARARTTSETTRKRMQGERPARAPESLRVRELAQMQPEQGGWILLGERAGEEIALGLVGKFWRPVIQYAQVSADRFVGFEEPGYAKTVYDLSVRRLPEGRSMLSGLMRTATTDDHSRRWFRRYWTFAVGSGSARPRPRPARDGSRYGGTRAPRHPQPRIAAVWMVSLGEDWRQSPLPDQRGDATAEVARWSLRR
jgi:hypothetical protein